MLFVLNKQSSSTTQIRHLSVVGVAKIVFILGNKRTNIKTELDDPKKVLKFFLLPKAKHILTKVIIKEIAVSVIHNCFKIKSEI